MIAGSTTTATCCCSSGGTYGSGEDPPFEVDITRQFIRADVEEQEIWQLSLTFFFPPTEITSGDRWCHAPQEADDFANFVRSHGVYAAVALAPPIRVELDFETTG